MQLYLSLSGIILSAILLYFNARNNKSTIYLGIFSLLAGLYSFSYYALLNSGSVTLAVVVLLRKHDLWHLLPVLLFLIMTSPYLLLTFFSPEIIRINI